MRTAMTVKVNKNLKNSSGGMGVLTRFLFVVINVFHKGPYEPPLRNNCIPWGVRTSISNETYSQL